MNRIAKLATGAALAAGLALTATVPADAGISIGIGIGGPGHPRHWCYYHPGACRGYVGPYVEGGYWAGHGYWHGGRWWGHRERWHGGWRYR
ncbi:MAG: hypothetical protein ACLQUZ_17050 [Rhizomicrobium sp.]